MIYKIAYVGFAAVYIIGTLFDSKFQKCWSKYLVFLMILFTLIMQLLGIA